MRILLSTTCNYDFCNSAIFATWLFWILRGLGNFYGHELDLAVGCMPDKEQGSFEVLDGLIKCTPLPDLEGLEDISKNHHAKFSVSYPDIRRMMMVGSMATSGNYDVLVYLDVDAFVVGNFLPELMYIKQNMREISAVFSRGQIPGEICNGFFAIFDSDIVNDWIQEGIYAQSDLNKWMRDSYNNTFKNDTCGNEGKYQNICQRYARTADNATWRLALLPHERYDRPKCMKYEEISCYRPDLKVYHCHSSAFEVQKKLTTMRNVGMLLNEADYNVKNMVKRRIGQTICRNSSSLSYNLESRGITWENLTYVPTWQTEICTSKLKDPWKSNMNSNKIASDPLSELENKDQYKSWLFPDNGSTVLHDKCIEHSIEGRKGGLKKERSYEGAKKHRIHEIEEIRNQTLLR